MVLDRNRDVVTRWIVDPTKAKEGATESVKAIEDGVKKTEDANKRLERSNDKAAKSFKKSGEAAKASMDRTRGGLRGLERGFSTAMVSQQGFAAAVSGSTREVLLSATSMGVLGGAIAAVGLGIGILAKGFGGASEAMRKQREEAEKASKAHASRLEQLKEEQAILETTRRFLRDQGRLPSADELTLARLREEAEALNTSVIAAQLEAAQSGEADNFDDRRAKRLAERLKRRKEEIALLERNMAIEKSISDEVDVRGEMEKAAEKTRQEFQTRVEQFNLQRLRQEQELGELAKRMGDERLAQLELQRREFANQVRSLEELQKAGAKLSTFEEHRLARMREALAVIKEMVEARKEELETGARLGGGRDPEDDVRQFGSSMEDTLYTHANRGITDGIFDGFENARDFVGPFARDMLQSLLQEMSQLGGGEGGGGIIGAILGIVRGIAGLGGESTGLLDTSLEGVMEGGADFSSGVTPVLTGPALDSGIQTSSTVQSTINDIGRSVQSLDQYRGFV